jgi:iron(III) transport system ATP-binding protein
MAYLSVQGISKAFAGVPAVLDLDLDVDQGTIVSLLGPSGCGKTTTLRMLAGFTKPDQGTIELGGVTLSSARAVVPPEKRRMGMVFQSYALWPHMTVAQNVRFGPQRMKVGRQEAQRRVGDMLDLVGLSHAADRYPHELSGGQQQRVALARALATRPAILLLDEPLSNLDTQLRENMRIELKRLRTDSGGTFVYVTHDQSEALALSDQVAIMQGGRLAQLAKPRDIYERPASLYVAEFIGAANKINCRVVGPGGQVRLDTTDVTLTGQLLSHSPSVGNPAVLVVRPENIRLSAWDPSIAPSSESIAGTVIESSYLGAAVDCRVDISGVSLRVSADAGLSLAAGAKVNIHLDHRDLLILPPEPSTAAGTAQANPTERSDRSAT